MAPGRNRPGAALFGAILCGVALAACHGSTLSDDAFGQRVRAYLLAHPEVLAEMSQKLEAKAAADDAAAMRKAEAALPALRASLEHDPADAVANPTGSVTVTEFYDYRCPHCENAAPQVLALIQQDPKVRVVFKEMPIFGPSSEHAAQDALAVKAAGGDFIGLYRAYMAARPLTDAEIDRLALAHGAHPSDLAPNGVFARKVKAQLARNAALFNKLNLSGTPTFVIGDEIIPGEDMEAVRTAVAKAEAAHA